MKFNSKKGNNSFFSAFQMSLSQKRSSLFYFIITLIVFVIGYYSYFNSYVWLCTDLGDTLFPVQRTTCKILPSKDAISPSELKNLKIGMLMLYDNTDGTWDTELMGRVIKNREKYCSLHNCTIINANKLLDKSRPPAWSKMIAMKHYLPQFDYLMYIDMDVIIMNFDISLTSLIAKAPKHDFIMTNDWNGPNTGVWFAKNSPFSSWFLEKAWNQSQLVGKTAKDGTPYPFEYEQRSFHYMLNTKVWKQRNLPHYVGNTTELWNHFYTFPQCSMNSYIMHPFYWKGFREDSHFVKGDFMVHFAGKKGQIKKNLMLHFLAEAPK